jgi:hypothetical protein
VIGDILFKMFLLVLGVVMGYLVCAILTAGVRADAYNEGWYCGYNEGIRLYQVGAKAGTDGDLD